MQLLDRFLIWLATPAMVREQKRLRAAAHTERPCGLAGCKEPAIHHVQWGVAGEQQGNMCEKHMRETWEMCHHQVATGLCFWTQGVPK